MRWRTVSMVFQGAMNALDPVMRVADQIAEAIRLHEPDVDRRASRSASPSCSATSASARRAPAQYPHEFSGGMRQRVMIALALACKPELIIGDEPTTALDVMMQAQILELLEELRRELGLAMILITHDLSVLAETCDRVAIMYAGQIAEHGPSSACSRPPQHPYTQRLLAAFPAIGGPRELAPAIPGVPPDPAEQPPGLPRSRRAATACAERCARRAPAAAARRRGRSCRVPLSRPGRRGGRHERAVTPPVTHAAVPGRATCRSHFPIHRAGGRS